MWKVKIDKHLSRYQNLSIFNNIYTHNYINVLVLTIIDVINQSIYNYLGLVNAMIGPGIVVGWTNESERNILFLHLSIYALYKIWVAHGVLRYGTLDKQMFNNVTYCATSITCSIIYEPLQNN